MNTNHRIINCNANNTKEYISDKSVALVITSPPYPMIEMWDEIFSSQSEEVRKSIELHDYDSTFENMHKVLDSVWDDIDRVLIDGGIACINIGDATKNCDGVFKLFSNHTRIINKFLSMGYDVLPDINWHKQTNAPNKFMGSGMYPPCAYVTYEHEYILVFRKGSNRVFKNKDDKENRHKSAYFWEERNVWFSDLWELKGIKQLLTSKNTRNRSAAFPFEIAYRLVNMYSVKGDYVYDPFSGTGTVSKASLTFGRNSYGVDIDKELCDIAEYDIMQCAMQSNSVINERINSHIDFINNLPDEKKEKLYQNINHNFKVKTRQEVGIEFCYIKSIEENNGVIKCEYEKADI